MLWDILKVPSRKPSKLVSSVSLLDEKAKEIHTLCLHVQHTKFNQPIHSQISGANDEF